MIGGMSLTCVTSCVTTVAVLRIQLVHEYFHSRDDGASDHLGQFEYAVHLYTNRVCSFSQNVSQELVWEYAVMWLMMSSFLQLTALAG